MDKMVSFDTASAENHSRKIIEEIFSMLFIDPYNNFQSNWNYQSFIQKSLDNNLPRPLIFIMDFLLNKSDESRYKTVIMQDLPQLLIQDQVSISAYLNEY